MSSSRSRPIQVSLCVVRVELTEHLDRQQHSDTAMAARKTRGHREPTDIRVESYAGIGAAEGPLLSGSTACGQTNPSGNTNGNGNAKNGAEQVGFILGNPFVEVTKGILHLYKEDELTEMKRASERSHTICILSVPATMTCQDLLTFTAACHQDIQHFRILRDGNPNQYMALISFRTASAAREFYETFNGAPYNSLEAESVCQLVFVSRVECGVDGLSLEGHTELPLCPVCLERMDESVDGILTIQCNHTFHSGCLAKWGDTSCPVCRYAQTPEPLADSNCMECVSPGSNDALWICLICGHIGCSRYHQGHAFEHYRDTHHCYAMQLGNNRVWDYVGDNFVHRLLQDKDGKMVEGGGPSGKAGHIDGEAHVFEEDKLDSVQLEFTYLLTSHLEKQRRYYEQKITSITDRTAAEAADMTEHISRLFEENARLKERVDSASRDKQSWERRVQATQTRLRECQSSLTEERELRQSLCENQRSWKSKCSELEAQVVELREQIRDLIFYVEAQDKVEKSALKEDIQGGSILIKQNKDGPSTSGAVAGHKTKARSRRKH